MAGSGIKIAAKNQKVYHDYFVEETYEAGVSLVGTDAGFWYTAFAADALDGEFVSEAASVRGTGGVLPLSVDADPQTHPTRFVRVVVSRDPCESAGVALSAFLAR